MSTSLLLTPGSLGPLQTRNRLVMAPLTRMRAGLGHVPTPMNAAYYRQRATAGLIITEATPVSPYGHGYANTPGIHTAAQVEGWKPVTEAVHQQGGLIFQQLWHVGRMSHPDLQPGHILPIGPSALAPHFSAATLEGPKPAPVPRALTLQEIPGVVAEFALGASHAKQAGFDGVEIHGANGYLLEQFLSDCSNHRTDAYGGSLENRARFVLEVVAAVVDVWGADRVGIRLSPANQYGGIAMTQRWETFSYLVGELNRFGLAYIHLVEPRVAGNNDIAPAFDLGHERFRPLIDEPTKLIAAGGFTQALGEQALATGSADFIAFGRLFIANPDLPQRFRIGAPLNDYDRATFYGGNEHGYLDYPTLDQIAAAH